MDSTMKGIGHSQVVPASLWNEEAEGFSSDFPLVVGLLKLLLSVWFGGEGRMGGNRQRHRESKGEKLRTTGGEGNKPYLDLHRSFLGGGPQKIRERNPSSAAVH